MSPITLLVIPTPELAHSTSGGPLVAELLGFDRLDAKVYYVIWNRSGGGDTTPRVHYFNLRAENPARAVPVQSWYDELGNSFEDKRRIKARIETLRSRLEPLDSLSIDLVQLDVDTLANKQWVHPGTGNRRCQYELAIHIAAGSYRALAEATAYCNAVVGVTEWTVVPEDSSAIVSIFYTGIPFETCYRKPIVMLVRKYPSGKH